MDLSLTGGVTLRPDARDQIARWLWIQDVGSDFLWPHAGETLRRPFLEAADDILLSITTQRAE